MDGFIFSIFATVALALAFAISLGAAADYTDWTRTETGCYVMTDNKPTVWWSDAKGTVNIQTYCPVER